LPMTPTEKFMHAIRSHPDSKVMLDAETVHVMFYGCIVELKPIDDHTVRLEKILSTIHPGEGRGSRVLRVITDGADRYGVVLTGVIHSFDDGLSNEQLAGWYKRHLFEVRGTKITRLPRQLCLS
jgi:hypothetical protein